MDRHAQRSIYAKILVPLDGSPFSESILPYARKFSKAFGLPVELMHVIAPESLEVFMDPKRGRSAIQVQTDFITTSNDYLERTAASFPGSPKVQWSVEVGEPAKFIVDRASREAGTLVAMASGGYSGIKRWFIGSVAAKVLHETRSPLLLVRGAAEKAASEEAALDRILVPLDGSILAEKALPHALAISRAMNLAVELLQVYTQPLSAIVPPAYPAGAEKVTGMQIAQAARTEAEVYLKEKMHQLLENGAPRASYVVSEGDAATRIIDMAQQTGDNLIAMSTHGRSGIRRWMLGSVAERVVWHSGDPILVIQASEKER